MKNLQKPKENQCFLPPRALLEGLLELSWAVLGRLGALLGRLDAVLGASLAVLGHLGPSLCQLGSLGSRPGGHLGRLEAEKSAGEAK